MLIQLFVINHYIKKSCLHWFQEKYRRDQEKLEEEWRRAQEEFYGEGHGGPEVRGL